MRRQFKDTVLELAPQDDKLVLVFGDISVFLFREFSSKYPERFYNLGILENTIVSVGAGLKSQGLNPFVHTIAPFITDRCVEQIKLDMCYNRFGGNIVTCGASFDYAWDGATHHTYTDLAMMRMLPWTEVLQPGTKRETDTLLRSQYKNDKTTYYRLSDHPHHEDFDIEFGKGVVLKDNGAPLTIMTAGPILRNVIPACEDLNVNLVYFHTLKPIDKEVIQRFADTRILVVHDAHGLYEAINEVPYLQSALHGLPDQFCVWYGTVDDIRKEVQLDPAGIRAAIERHLELVI